MLASRQAFGFAQGLPGGCSRLANPILELIRDQATAIHGSVVQGCGVQNAAFPIMWEEYTYDITLRVEIETELLAMH
jgi:hypothetical protein